METHFKLLKLDETQYWAKDITDGVGKLYGVYLIDTLEHTYCCEMTPSYCAYFLYTTSDTDLSDMNDIEREDLWDLIAEGDMIYTEPISYFHVHSITEFAHDFGLEDDDYYHDDYDRVVEDMIEHCVANWYV